MERDPIIQELRDIRKNIEEECKKNNQSYFSHLLEVQDKYKDRLVDDIGKPKTVNLQSA